MLICEWNILRWWSTWNYQPWVTDDGHLTSLFNYGNMNKKKKNLQKLQTGLNQNSVWAMQPLMSLFFFLSWYTLNLLLYWGIFFFHRKKSEEKTEKHLNPLKVLMQTEEVMTDNTVMVADGGDFVSTAAYILR
jgi:hypothetical protein